MNFSPRILSVFFFLSFAFSLNAQIPEFTRIDTGALVQDIGNSQGSSIADIDSDGDMDLLIGNTSSNGPSRPVLLYKNERNGRFARIVHGDLAFQNQPNMMPTATFVDIDNDGDWDVSTPCVFYINDGFGSFVMQYMNPESEEGCGDQVTSWVDVNNDGYLDCSIWSQLGRSNKLFMNNGDGTFTRNPEDPFNSTPLHTECLSWADMDNDGDMDVFASNFSFFDTQLQNNRNSCFINVLGVLVPMEQSGTLLGDTLGSGGASWGDCDNDGDLDLYVSTFRGTNHLYKNQGDGTFAQETIDPPEAIDLGFMGSAWGDFDNDGDLDLFVTSDLNDLPFADFANFNMLFENNGDGSFSEIASGNLKMDGGHSCTLLDYDNDGDLDILIPNGSLGGDMINYLYTNEGNNNHWINISCKGTESNAAAIGTRIYIHAKINGEPAQQMRELSQQTGMHSISSPRFHFGLGDAEVIDSLIIRWPSGIEEKYQTVKADQFYSAVEGLSLTLDYSASNSIEFWPPIQKQEIISGESVSLNLTDHFRFVAGDSLPEIMGDTLQFMLTGNSDPQVLIPSLEGNILTLHAGYTAGISNVKIKVSTEGIASRVDIIGVQVMDDTTTLNTYAQTHLVDPIGKPVLGHGSPGEWDDAVVWNPAVVKDGDTLRMWYTGHNESIWTPSTIGEIGYSWSLDGYTWNKFTGNPVLQGELEWEGGKLNGCAVIKDGELFKMWYGAGWSPAQSGYEISPAKVIGYAESQDGKVWNKYPEAVLETGQDLDWDSDFIVPHTVIKEENEYKMWFWAGKPGFPVEEVSLPQIGLATSPDGIHWTKYDNPSTTEPPYAKSDPVLFVGPSTEWDAQRVIDPIVLETESGYEMWYTGLQGPITSETRQKIGYARSVDGINWTKWQENPILDDSFIWGDGIYGGSVLKFDETYHIWFACFHTPPTQARPQIGYANSRDIYIPDSAFRHALIEADVDSSGDGLISRNEAAACKGLYLNNKGISNMAGLEAFVNLYSLEVSDNNLMKLDVSNNHYLTSLVCNNNHLSALDVSACDILSLLNCGVNALESLVINNTRLFSLACNDNQISYLDVSKDSLLLNLYCNNNRITELDVSQNSHLQTLYCGNNQLVTLDISGNQDLGKYKFPGLDGGYAPWFSTIPYYYDLDIEVMPTLNKVCTWEDFAALLASESTDKEAIAATDSVYVKMNGSPNVHFTTDCTAPVIVTLDTSSIPDSVIVEISEEAIIYLVEEGTEMELSIILEAFIGSAETDSGIAVIHLDIDKLWNGTWWLYACDTSGNLSEPKEINITGVGTEINDAERVKIYPNPVNGILTINTRLSDWTNVKVTSLNGQLLISELINDPNYKLDLSSYSKGIYFITIKTNNFITTRKIIKL